MYITILFLVFFYQSNQKLKVVHPPSLKKLYNNGEIPANLGNFGHLIYGQMQMGKLHYPSQNQMGCRKFEAEDFGQDQLFDEENDMNPIVLLDRGGCSFVQKVRNLEDFGIKVGIIADNRDEHTEDYIMADDGSGVSIHIPSFLISKKDGFHLKYAIINSFNSVFIQGEIEMVHPDNRVEYEFWYSSVLDFDKNSLFDLGQFLRIFKEDTYFTPRIMTYDCSDCDQDFKEKECLSDGKYCSYRPKNNIKFQQDLVGVNGVDMLKESLRTVCVYLVTNQDQFEQQYDVTTYFDYVINYFDECIHPDQSFQRACTQINLVHLKIQYQKIEKCLNNSFEEYGNYNSDNKYLRADREFAKKLGVSLHPSITINNITYRGDYTGYDIFRAICVGFDKTPDECIGDNVYQYLANQPFNLYRKSYYNRFGYYFRHMGTISKTIVILIIVGIVFLNIFVLYAYKKYQKKKFNNELQFQVNSAVSQYFRLSGNEHM